MCFYVLTDDLLIIQDTESALHKSVFKLNQTCQRYNIKITTAETKVNAYRGGAHNKTAITDQTVLILK